MQPQFEFIFTTLHMDHHQDVCGLINKLDRESIYCAQATIGMFSSRALWLPHCAMS